MLPRSIAGCGVDAGSPEATQGLPLDAIPPPRCKAKEGCGPPTPNPRTQWTCPSRRNHWKPSPVSEVAPPMMGSLHLGIGSRHHYSSVPGHPFLANSTPFVGYNPQGTLIRPGTSRA